MKKRTKKLFPVADISRRFNQRARGVISAKCKSFLVLFFKKELFFLDGLISTRIGISQLRMGIQHSSRPSAVAPAACRKPPTSFLFNSHRRAPTLNKLMDELGTAALAVHDTKTRFRLMANAGDRQAARDILARPDEHDHRAAPSPAA